MKYLALLLVAAGVGLTAAFGASPIEPARELYEREMVAVIEGAEAEELLAAYCEAREEAELAYNAQCPDPEPPEEETSEGEAAEDEAADSEEEPEEDEGPNLAAMSEEERIAHLESVGEAELMASIDLPEELSEEVEAARQAWIDAQLEAVAAGARVGALDPLPAPGERLSIWIKEKIPFFALGLVLIVVGSLIARNEAHKEATGEGAAPADGQKGPVDLGALLGSLADDVEAIAAEIAEPDPKALDSLKKRINDLILEKVEPIVESGTKVQVKFGLEGFAAIFAPFSAGERRLNRTWAALSDEHWPEATESIKRAALEFRTAVNEMSARSR